MRDTWAGSAGRRAEFEARGWLILRGVVSPSDLTELNRTFDELMAPSGVVPGAAASATTLKSGACRTDDVMLGHLHNGVAEIACHLLGAPSIQLLQDGLLLKRPSPGGSIALHQDYTYTGFLDPPDIVSVGLALNDASAESGCLHVVDGSHTWGLVGDRQIFASALSKDLLSLLSPTQREAVDLRCIPLEVRAGDVTIHHGLTLHGSGDNRSARPRKTIVTHLFSGACRVVFDRLPAANRHQFVTDADGHLIGPEFPTLYALDGEPSIDATSGSRIGIA